MLAGSSIDDTLVITNLSIAVVVVRLGAALRTRELWNRGKAWETL